MRRRIVLDVNIIASAFASEIGAPHQILFGRASRDYRLVASEHILDGVRNTMLKPYFLRRVSIGQRAVNMRRLLAVAEMVEPDRSVMGVCDDEEDDLVLGTVVAAEAAFLVTGDHGLLEIGSFRGVSIVTASDFLVAIGDDPLVERDWMDEQR